MSNKISAVVLAGGASSRMQGCDKGLLQLDGVALAGRVIEKIAPHVCEIMLSANRNLERYRELGYPVHADSGESLGPLSGVLCALRRCTHPLLLAVPCDTPLIPNDLAPRLYSGLNRSNSQVAVPVVMGKIQHAIMLMRIEALPELERFLADGGRRVGAWQQRLKTQQVEFPDPAAFHNINTRQELEQAQALLERTGGVTWPSA